MWIPCNRFMAEDGIVDNEELAMAYLDATVGLSENAPAANRERRRTYVVEASQMLEFLIGRGIRFQRLRNYPEDRKSTSELQSLMRISYAVFCLKKKTKKRNITHT